MLPRSPRRPEESYARLERRGPKTRAWERIRRQLKCWFWGHGITTCELQLPGCWIDDGLGFAHRYKRDLITDEEELRVVVLACNHCHQIAELQGHAKMKKIMDGAIRDRELRLAA